jgi:hypothetical protein
LLSAAHAEEESGVEVTTAIAATTAIGAAVYVWLTVSLRPMTGALLAMRRSRGRHGWPYALPLAIGVSTVTAAAAFACAVVIAMCAPYIGAVLADPGVLIVGASSGLLVWSVRAAALGAPRLSPDVEMALVLAVVALKSDDPALLSRVEREYARQVLDPDDRYMSRVARTVLGV